jgi:hypothetical protein
MTVHTMLHRRAWLVLLGLLLAAGTPSRSLWACGGEKVRVTVVVIVATESDDKVDPKLKCIAHEVRKKYPKLTGFRLAKMSCRSLPVGKKEAVRLLAREVVHITALRGAGEDGCIRLKITPPKMGEITYETACAHGFLPIVTPCKVKGKGRIIFAVRVQPCHKD